MTEEIKSIKSSPIQEFFDNDFLLSYFIKNYIGPNILPMLKRVSNRFNNLCQVHWEHIYCKACEPYHWYYGGKMKNTWNGKDWEKLYVITTIKNCLLFGTFGGSIESRQEPLKRIDVHGMMRRDSDSFDIIDPSVYTPKNLIGGRQAAASAINWKLSEIWSVGGFNPQSNNALRSIEIFKTNTLTSHSFPLKLKKPRCFATATFDANSNMIVAGGCSTLFTGAEVYSSLEVYNFGSSGSTFDIIPTTMNVLRGGHQSVYDWRRNRLYCLGGYGGGSIYHDSIEYVDLNPEMLAASNRRGRNNNNNNDNNNINDGGFKMCEKKMKFQRTGAGADFGSDGAIYICGGSPDGARGLDSLERYDPREGTFEQLAPMNHPRGYLAAKFGPNGMLYAAGGSALEQFDLFVMEAYHQEVEVYDRRMDTWYNSGNLVEDMADLTIQLWYDDRNVLI